MLEVHKNMPLIHLEALKPKRIDLKHELYDFVCVCVCLLIVLFK